jgi:hypothetical protein
MKRWLLLIAGLILAPIGAAVYWWVQPMDPINAATFNRIQVGMTQQEVENILGGPGGEIQEEIQGHFVPGQWTGSPTVWYGRQNAIIIRFQSQGDAHVVGSKELFNPGVWDRLKAWWGGYELDPFPVGGRAKRLEPAA